MHFLKTNELLNHQDKRKFSDIVFDAYLKNFTEDIMVIYTSYSKLNTDIFFQDIIKIPWIFCKIYSTQQKNNYNWSHSSYDIFARSCKRLFEFTLYIHSLQSTCLNQAYLSFNHNTYNDLINYYFNEIDTISQRGFNIKKSQSKNHIDFIDTTCHIAIKYPPTEIVQAPKNLQDIFKKYLLITSIVMRIYHADDSKNKINGRNPKGQWGKRATFDTDETDFTKALIEKKRDYHSVENRLEDVGKAKFSSSPLLNSITKEILGFQPASENNLYKRTKIARAISTNIAKQNQELTSNYTIPEKTLFSEFLKQKIIIKNMSFESNLFLASLLLAVNHDKLLRVMLGMDDSIIIDLKHRTLSVQLKSSIFAQNSKQTSLYTEKLKSSHTIKTILPDNLVKLLQTLEQDFLHIIKHSSIINEEIDLIFDAFNIQEEAEFIYKEVTTFQFKKRIDDYFSNTLKDKSMPEISEKLTEISFLSPFFQEITQHLRSFTKQQVKNFPKKIIIHINNLPYIHKIYLNNIDPSTKTERLFFSHITKSEEVKMCYTSMPATYTLQAEWYLLLQKHLGIKEVLNTKFTDNKNSSYDTLVNSENKIVGSPFFVQAGRSKNFFLSLIHAIHIPNTDEVTKDCIRMVYIRYALSILLGTRDFHHSCDLGNHSTRYGILALQEKAKDTRSSKRIIPLCNTAVQLIHLFHTIKNKYNHTQHAPVLIIQDENQILFEKMTQNNIIKWIKDNALHIDTNFIKSIPQNYGRHVIKSNTINSHIKDEFINAFLNHHSSGTEDQGMFSTFSNLTYFKEIKDFMEKIASDYLPAYGLENLL